MHVYGSKNRKVWQISYTCMCGCSNITGTASSN